MQLRLDSEEICLLLVELLENLKEAMVPLGSIKVILFPYTYLQKWQLNKETCVRGVLLLVDFSRQVFQYVLRGQECQLHLQVSGNI